MGKKQRHFDTVFKRRLVAEIESGERSQAQVAREEHISPSLLQRWRNQVGSGTLVDRPTARERALEKELERYKKKLGELTMELELEKKLRETSRHLRRSNGCVVTGLSTAPFAKDARR
jgi:transposase-like protein